MHYACVSLCMAVFRSLMLLKGKNAFGWQRERERYTEELDGGGGWGIGRERALQTRCVSGSMCATCDSQPYACQEY